MKKIMFCMMLFAVLTSAFAAGGYAETKHLSIDIWFGDQAYTNEFEVSWGAAQEPTPTPTPTPEPEPTDDGIYELDETGAAILKIQQLLDEMGYYEGAITGHFGELTQRAVMQFQFANGLKADGIVDQQTMTALEDAAAESCRRDDSNAQVLWLQRMLKNLDVYYGDITGTFGRLTERAVATLQQKYGFEETGIADAKFIQTLKRMAFSVEWFADRGDIPSFLMQNGVELNTELTMTDLRTGHALKIRAQEFDGHMEAEPLTSADTTMLCAIYGVADIQVIIDQNLYQRRPMMLTTADGVKMICSIYGVPHGDDLLAGNGYEGQFCLHFLNSLWHGVDRIDEDHQNAIAQAQSILISYGMQTMQR